MSGSTSDASLIVPDFTISLSGSSCNYLFSFSIYSLPSHSVIQRNCKIREFNSHLTEASLKVEDFNSSLYSSSCNDLLFGLFLAALRSLSSLYHHQDRMACNKIKTERTRRAGGGCKQFSPPSPRLWLWYNTYSTRTSLGRELRNRFTNYNRVT